MNRSLFSPILSLLLLCALTLVCGSCNREDVIEAGRKPVITLDDEYGIYTAHPGEELTIAPTYESAEGASFRWSCDGELLSTSPALTYTWEIPGEYYIDLTVTTSSGSSTEELRVDVVERMVPAITLPVEGDEMLLLEGTEFEFAPQFTHTDVEGFAVEWKLNGSPVATGPVYLFKAAKLGEYTLTVTASNVDGSSERTLMVKVVDQLPYTLRFPTPSYFQNSTERFTFPGRAVYLTPLMENLKGESFAWKVNGSAVECSSATFRFTPEAAGTYTVAVTVDGTATASVKVTAVDATERGRYRTPSGESVLKVWEYCPAPGQFIGETGPGGMTGNESTLEEANAWAVGQMQKGLPVSLGSFGGYIVMGFNHSIPLSGGNNPDFAIIGNAFFNAGTTSGGSSEPGIVYVMQDVNGNGLPDDEWYELRASETGLPGVKQNFAVTYFRPAGAQMDVAWTSADGKSGVVKYLGLVHSQPSYYPAWVKADAYTLWGTSLPPRTWRDESSRRWNNDPFAWGYADNMGSDLVEGFAAGSEANGFRIANAMYPDFSAIGLLYVDFIKVQTGVLSSAGSLGELSTEVLGLRCLSSNSKK